MSDQEENKGTQSANGEKSETKRYDHPEARPVASRPAAGKPRSFAPRGAGAGRPARPYAPRGAAGDRPARPYTPRVNGAAGDRPVRPFTPRANGAAGDRPARPYAPRANGAAGDRPARPFTPRANGAAGDRPARPFTPRANGAAGDRPARPYAPRANGAAGDRPARPFTPRTNGAAGDRPARPFTPHGAAGARPHGGFTARRPDAPKRPVSDGLPARKLAYDVLLEVADKDAYATLALDKQLAHTTMPVVDRHLAASLVYDTLDNLIRIDWVLAHYMAKPDTDIKLKTILRLAACQLLFYDRIPESAAVNTAVTLCKNAGMEGLAGVCNGILRSLCRGKDELIYPDREENVAKYLSVMFSVPEWLAEKLIADYGMEKATAIASFRERNKATVVRPNLTQLDDADFEKLLGKKVWTWEKGVMPHAYLVRGATDIARDADFLSGMFSIQGQSSMLAAMAVGVKPGMQVLDACAAPGGKSCLMAEMMNGSGRVQSWELHEHRTGLIEAQCRRLHLDNVRPMTRDAIARREDIEQTMDAVLLDAPCSGTGVLSDKPDVKYRLTPESIESLVKTQEALLESCCRYVKRGGVLVYSTCSLLKCENEEQLRAFLTRHPEFTVEALPETIPEALRAQYGELGVQLLPERGGMDGFFVARLRRAR